MKIIYCCQAPLSPDRRNMNWTQRVMHVPPDVELVIVTGADTEVTVELPRSAGLSRAARRGPFWYLIHAARQMASARRSGATVVVTDRSAVALLAPLLRRLGHFRWVIDWWDAPHKELVAFHQRSNSIGTRLRRLGSQAKVALLRRTARSADLVLLSIEPDSVVGYELPASRVRHFQNAIELPDPAANVPLRQRGLTVCFVSRRILADRRLDLVLGALRELRSEGMPVQFTIAGELAPTAQRLVESVDGDWVTCLGTTSVARAQAVMRSSRIGVIPLEGNADLSYIYPVKLLEYMACGTVVVASDLPGIRAVVSDEKEALLVPPTDGRALHAALARALRDDDLALSLTGAALRRSRDFDAAAKAEAIYSAVSGDF